MRILAASSKRWGQGLNSPQSANMLFPANLHRLDRVARIAVGFGMIAAGWIAADGVPAFVLRLFAVYPLATGLMGWSPVYEIFTSLKKR